MRWKEIWATTPGPLARGLGNLALVSILLLAAWFTFEDALMSAEELLEQGYHVEFTTAYHRLELNVSLRYLVTFAAGVLLVWVSSVAACSVVGEREQHTWVSLIATPLTPFEILRGKAIGVFWSVRGLLAVWFALIAMGLLLGAVHPLGVLAVALATATYLAFGCALGMAWSLHARSSTQAIVSTLFTLVVLNGGLFVLSLPWKLRSTLPLVGLTPFVEESVLLSHLDVRWLLDFETPDARRLGVGGTCLLSVTLYAAGTLILARWMPRTFDRVDRQPRPPAARPGAAIFSPRKDNPSPPGITSVGVGTQPPRD